MRTFIGFGQQTYIGIPQAQAAKLGGIATTVVPLLFQWISYGAQTTVPNVNVLVDLSGSACKSLDQIRSVYIDNLGSDNPVYVYFPDTNYTLVAKPNSEGWYPVFTNQRQIWVIGEGFLTGDIPQTFILLSNLFLTPQVNVELDQAISKWLGSPIITRGLSIYNSGFGVPALGDQFFSSAGLNMNGAGFTVGLWNTPYPSGFLYVRTLYASAVAINQGVSTAGSLTIESTGAAGTLMNLNYLASPTVVQGPVLLTDLKDMQLKLDATQTWRARITNTVQNGTAFFLSAFTQQ